MRTVISTDRAAAVELLRQGEIVALPTETVYGLAADALNPIAVAKIFEAKERPRFDPLILHLPSRGWLEKIAEIPSKDRNLILKLAKNFWPGPFTIILPKREIVSEIVTAGLNSVAIRISAHPVLVAIVRKLDRPLAAPSANRFGQISPTSAQHVVDELDGRIPLVIDGGPTQHGIESTIVAVSAGQIQILRRGPIAAEQLSEFGKVSVPAAAQQISVPGQLPSHYAPKTPLRLVDNLESLALHKNQRVGLLAWSGALPRVASSRLEIRHAKVFAAVRKLSEREDLREAAANLFRYLRELDGLGLDLIIAQRVPSRGLGAAIMDRLERAAHVRARV
ncbi:MAG TPA: L-threonylcarbamoyladenylate synthase [Candidatus Udaeobacter sp.]|nr:L-threonylcarbamoyladenylate synthase [Candidatus Udaeobacter sp.]